jgi:hypothetical protein
VGMTSYWSEDSDGDFLRMQGQITTIADQKRAHLREQLLKTFPIHFEAMLLNETNNVLQAWSREVLQDLTKENVRSISESLRCTADLLTRTATEDLIHDKLQVRPLIITPDARGSALWEQLLSGAHSRLHLLIPELNDGLRSVLTFLGPETEVRVITVAAGTRGQDEAAFNAAFGNWNGRFDVRLISSRSQRPLNIPYTLIILDDVALVAHEQLQCIGSSSISFIDHNLGLRAAERLFAEAWEGKATDLGEIAVEPLVRRASRSSK